MQTDKQQMSKKGLFLILLLFISLMGISILSIIGFTPHDSSHSNQVSVIAFMQDIPVLLSFVTILILTFSLNLWGLAGRLWPWTALDLLRVNLLWVSIVIVWHLLAGVATVDLGFLKPKYDHLGGDLIVMLYIALALITAFWSLAFFLGKSIHIWGFLVLSLLFLFFMLDDAHLLFANLSKLIGSTYEMDIMNRLALSQGLTSFPVFFFSLIALWRCVNWQQFADRLTESGLRPLFIINSVLIVMIGVILALFSTDYYPMSNKAWRSPFPYASILTLLAINLPILFKIGRNTADIQQGRVIKARFALFLAGSIACWIIVAIITLQSGALTRLGAILYNNYIFLLVPLTAILTLRAKSLQPTLTTSLETRQTSALVLFIWSLFLIATVILVILDNFRRLSGVTKAQAYMWLEASLDITIMLLLTATIYWMFKGTRSQA